MKKYKNPFFVILLCLLVGFVLYVYNAFNGNPISKAISKKVLTNYLSSQYPDEEFRIDDSFYNFKFSEYSFTVLAIGGNKKDVEGPDEFQCTVRGFINPEIQFDGIRYSRLDNALMERLSSEAELEISTVLEETGIQTKEIDVFLEVLKGQFPETITWDKHLQLDRPIDIFIRMDATEINKEEMYNLAKRIQETFANEGYEYQSVTINGNVIGDHIAKYPDIGYVKFSITFTENSRMELNDIKELNQDIK
ncbi:hypothetical protein J9303_14275 [Bacillaceae bacterium Marseille-Q3522]|nr:hypothetical protein [Bacillaceae bacterium Marseille-Q3522]